MRIALAAFVAQFAVACGGDSAAPAPPPIPLDRSAETEAAEEEEAKAAKSGELEPVVVTPTPTEGDAARVLAGTLTTTATVPFGGNGFCKYDITLRDVTIELELLPNGDVARARVRDLAVERALDGCPYGPMDPSMQDFTLKTQGVTTTGTRIEFVGSKANRPATALVVDLAASAAGYEATATWKRTDQSAPLAWSVTAKTTLAPK